MTADDPGFGDKESDEARKLEEAEVKIQPTTKGSFSRAPLSVLLVNLLLGGAAEGADQFTRRLKQWQAEVESRGDAIFSESPDETEGERLRYALIGLLASGTRASLAAILTAGYASVSAFAFFSTLLRPFMGSRLVEPVRRPLDDLAAFSEAMVERWIDAGRIIEQQNRTLARQAALDEFDEGMAIVLAKLAEDPAVGEVIRKQSDVIIKIMVDKLAQDPAVRDLIRQQSAGMADEVKDSLRKRSAVADERLEGRVHGLLGRH